MAKNNKVEENVTVENVQEEVQQATADAPVEKTKVSFSEKHPMLAAIGGKAKKVGKWIVIGVGAVGTAVLINKAGEAKGFNKAIDAMNNAGNNGTAEPEAMPEEIPQVEEEIPVVDDVTTTEF
jgi:hypothetical protein